MMELHGQNLIGGRTSGEGAVRFRATDPATGHFLGPDFHEATPAEVDQALEAARDAFDAYRAQPAERIAAFLDRIAEELVTLGDALLERGHCETGLPLARLTGERGRTVGQLRLFAEVVRDGTWLEATIDPALPERQPLPRPDLRRMLIPLGPVVVFGASNFPLAFSVAGGDTASALAAGNPVVVKAHPAHPGTSELAASAILKAAEATGMPAGVFSLVHGTSHDTGLRLVRHPLTRAVGFTGSLAGGRALFDAAVARPEPIPVYAEMGSTNPVFVLPGALEANGNALAEGLVQSVTLGVGQFCTNPGVVVGVRDSHLSSFVEKAAEAASAVAPGVMLHQGICSRYSQAVAELETRPGIRVAGRAAAPEGNGAALGTSVVFTTDARTFLSDGALREEIFGPSTIIVECESAEELAEVAGRLEGQLTATICGTPDDLRRHRHLVSILQTKVGRLLFNGFPTGVEVCAAMHHGGPYPATTDARTTSVGSAAIKRFARPICFQNFPDSELPAELQNGNPRGIWRTVNNQLTREALA